MSIAGTLITIGAAAIGYWVVRSVMQEPESTFSAKPAPPPPQPAPRKPLGPGSSARRGAPANPRSATRPSASRPPSATATRPRPSAPGLAWNILLDVPSDAGRREIQDALKRRIASARAEGDTAEVALLLRAARDGLRERMPSPRRRPPGPRAS